MTESADARPLPPIYVPIALESLKYRLVLAATLQRPKPPLYNAEALKAADENLAEVPHRCVQHQLHGPTKLGLK